MLFLEAAQAAVAQAAAAATGEGGKAVEAAPAFETGSLLHPIYANHLLDPKIIPEEVLISLVMTVLIIVTFVALTRRLDVRRPSRVQAALELIVTSLQNMAVGMIGSDGLRYLPVVGTLFIYILVLNLCSVIPLWKAPTANLNVTVALAVTTIIYIHYHGIRANGIVGYLKHYMGDPIWMAPLNFPLHIIGELARPISLSLRLFGNIFGEDTVVAILIMLGAKMLLPFQLLMIPLVIFTSFLQAMVFTMLTCVYIAGFVAHEEHEHEHAHGHGHGDGPGVLVDSPLPVPPV
jgi:F-type H+-transporting ATPase subunit a